MCLWECYLGYRVINQFWPSTIGHIKDGWQTVDAVFTTLLSGYSPCYPAFYGKRDLHFRDWHVYIYYDKRQELFIIRITYNGAYPRLSCPSSGQLKQQTHSD